MSSFLGEHKGTARSPVALHGTAVEATDVEVDVDIQKKDAQHEGTTHMATDVKLHSDQQEKVAESDSSRLSLFSKKLKEENEAMGEEEKARAASRTQTFKYGQRYYHNKHGPGSVDEVLEDGVIVMHFDNGDFHRYRPGNMHKLTAIVDDAHEFTPDTLFAMMDKDNSGHIDLEEFKALHDIIIKDEQKRAARIADLKNSEAAAKARASRLAKYLALVIAAVVLLLGCMAGLMVAVVAAYKDTKSTGSFFATTDGHVLQTTPALVALPMLVAPVMPWEQLQKVSQLTVTFESPDHRNFSNRTKAAAYVETVELVSPTAVKFYLAKGPLTEVHVWNGEVFGVLASSGDEVPLCEEKIDCSALMVDDAEDADRLLEKAKAELQAVGVSVRRLEEIDRRLLKGGSEEQCNMYDGRYLRSICKRIADKCSDGQSLACEKVVENIVEMQVKKEVKGKTMEALKKNGKCLGEICPGGVCPGDICSLTCMSISSMECIDDLDKDKPPKEEWCRKLKDLKHPGYSGYSGYSQTTLKNLRQLADRVDDYTAVHRPRSMPMLLPPSVKGRTLPTVDLVVAHFEEHSVHWLADVERDLPTVRIFVYEKGDKESLCHNLLHSATCVSLPNVGREAHSYMTHIVERYEQLGDKVVFTQGGAPGYGFLEGQEGGHLMPGSDFFQDYLSPATPPHVVFTMALQNVKHKELLLKRKSYPFNEPHPAAFPIEQPPVCGGSGDWAVLSKSPVHFWDALHKPNPLVDLPDPQTFWDTHLKDELGPLSDVFIPFANGAVLSAGGAALRERPRSFYEKLRNLAGVGNSPDAIFFMEMLFAYIMGHAAEARACSEHIQAASIIQA